jgi:hypothetical protein
MIDKQLLFLLIINKFNLILNDNYLIFHKIYEKNMIIIFSK